MKKLYYRIFKQDVYNEWIKLEHKKMVRLQSILKVKEKISKWSDLPLSYLMPELCDMLKIENNQAARYFMIECIMENNINELAKKIPLR